MKHDYTDEEIKTAWKDSLSLRAFLDALPERPQAAEIAKLKAEREKWEADALRYCKNADFWRSEHDKAQGILKACLSAMPFGNIETHTVENLPHRIADLASEIASLSLENERLEAEIAAMRQPLLADDGNAIQKIKFPDQEIETWEESAEVHDMLEAAAQAAAQAVAAVVLAQAVRRMEAVPLVELHSAYWAGRNPVCHNDALNRVRARLIAAARGEGQDKPVGVNEPPKSEEQPDLSGEGEKQPDEPATFEAHGYTWTRHKPGDPMPCDGGRRVFCISNSPDCYDGAMEAKCWSWGVETVSIIGWRYADEPEPAEPWTPAVGDTVRLKSGGPVMTVTHVDPLSLMCAWMNVNNELQVEPITTLCLTPVPPP